MENETPPPSDTASAAETGRPRIQENLKSKSTWLRLFFIVFFALLYGVAELVATVVIVVQFLWVLINGETNERLRALGQSLATYNYQVIRYMTYNSDDRPFPIDMDWPSGERDDGRSGLDG